MLNWEIDPMIVAPLVPFGTEIDFHQEKTFVSVVGFMFLKTRVLGIPIPFHRNFEELNLRFYIRRVEPESSGAGADDQTRRRVCQRACAAVGNRDHGSLGVQRKIRFGADAACDPWWIAKRTDRRRVQVEASRSLESSFSDRSRPSETDKGRFA